MYTKEQKERALKEYVRTPCPNMFVNGTTTLLPILLKSVLRASITMLLYLMLQRNLCD